MSLSSLAPALTDLVVQGHLKIIRFPQQREYGIFFDAEGATALEKVDKSLKPHQFKDPGPARFSMFTAYEIGDHNHTIAYGTLAGIVGDTELRTILVHAQEVRAKPREGVLEAQGHGGR